MGREKHRFYRDRIIPEGVRPAMTAADLVDHALLAFNGGKLRRACRLFASRVLEEDVTVGMSLAGALTPAGMGRSVVIPFIENGFVDWIVSTGANLYHDIHFGLDLALYQGSEKHSDVDLRRENVIRIYDVLFDYDVLLSTDHYLRRTMASEEFQRTMGTAELHHLLGKFLAAREDELGVRNTCVLSTAYRCGVPCYTSSPGDSSIGMNVAELNMRDAGPRIDVSRDVNETSSLVWHAKSSGGKGAALLLGGGSPKNFVLQTEPQIQEILGIEEWGFDYYIQLTDARPDTGGLSGATPSEGVSWGKVDPRTVEETTVAVYCDATIAAPMLAAYALDRRQPRPLKRLYDRREELYGALRERYLRNHRLGDEKRPERRPEF
jgi:deoxyhypusine synthase